MRCEPLPLLMALIGSAFFFFGASRLWSKKHYERKVAHFEKLGARIGWAPLRYVVRRGAGSHWFDRIFAVIFAAAASLILFLILKDCVVRSLLN